MLTPLFYPLVPGASLPGDWYQGSIPTNIEVGENSVIDSSFCFKQSNCSFEKFVADMRP